MTTSMISSGVFPHSPRHSLSHASSISSRHANMDRKSVFGALKSKLHSNSSSGTISSSNSNPFAAAPHTRRPSRPERSAASVHSPDEPLPAYSRTVPTDHTTTETPSGPGAGATSATPASQRPASPSDSRFSFLSTFDTIFVIDDSGSMAGRSWRECSQALQQIAPICTKYDADGIDIYFLNTPDSPMYRDVKEASLVQEIFSTVRPSGGTPMGQTLSRIIKKYLSTYDAAPAETKPLNIICITDGEPSDDVESVLVRAAQRLDAADAEPWQLGVQFVQVGEEQGATEYLEGLDDELSALGNGCRDIVDTVPFQRGRGGISAEAILKVVLGAVNRRLDRRQN